MAEQPLVIDVYQCSSCGHDHAALPFHPGTETREAYVECPISGVHVFVHPEAAHPLMKQPMNPYLIDVEDCDACRGTHHGVLIHVAPGRPTTSPLSSFRCPNTGQAVPLPLSGTDGMIVSIAEATRDLSLNLADPDASGTRRWIDELSSAANMRIRAAHYRSDAEANASLKSGPSTSEHSESLDDDTDGMGDSADESGMEDDSAAMVDVLNKVADDSDDMITSDNVRGVLSRFALPERHALYNVLHEEFRIAATQETEATTPTSSRLPDAEASSVNSRQVGGVHYGLRAFQHWDVVAMFNLDYFQGQITKYVMRWRDKNGVEDLEKGAHYLEKYIEVEKAKFPRLRDTITDDGIDPEERES